MQDSELYEKLLGLKEPWFVEKVSLDLSAACVTVLIGHSQGATFPCPVWRCTVRTTKKTSKLFYYNVLIL